MLRRYWIGESFGISHSSDISYFFSIPLSPPFFIRTTKAQLTMVPHAGLHSILSIPRFSLLRERKIDEKRKEGGGDDKISSPSSSSNEIVFSAVAHSVTRSELDAYLPRALTSGDLSPSASTLLKRSRRRRWIRDREPISFAKDAIDYGIKLRFRFSPPKGRRALIFHFSSRFNTCLIDICQIKVSIILKTRITAPWEKDSKYHTYVIYLSKSVRSV